MGQRRGVRRVVGALAGLGVVVSMTALAPPAGAAVSGVAQLTSQQDLLPPSKGQVRYEEVTATANDVVVRQGQFGAVTIEDGGVVIVGIHPSMSTGNCTSGVGSASCGYANSFAVVSGLGDDTVSLHGTFWLGAAVSAGPGNDRVELLTNDGNVHCGDGHDEVVASAGLSVSSNCEVVTRV